MKVEMGLGENGHSPETINIKINKTWRLEGRNCAQWRKISKE